jgi:hypothetical protein
MALSVKEVTLAGDAVAPSGSGDEMDSNVDENRPSENDSNNTRKSYIGMLVDMAWAFY